MIFVIFFTAIFTTFIIVIAFALILNSKNKDQMAEDDEQIRFISDRLKKEQQQNKMKR